MKWKYVNYLVTNAGKGWSQELQNLALQHYLITVHRFQAQKVLMWHRFADVAGKLVSTIARQHLRVQRSCSTTGHT